MTQKPDTSASGIRRYLRRAVELVFGLFVFDTFLFLFEVTNLFEFNILLNIS